MVLIKDNPGIKGAEIAKKLSITPPNAYQVLAKLRERKQVRVDRGQYFVAGGPANSEPAGEAAAPEAAKAASKPKAKRSRKRSKGKRKAKSSAK